MAANIQTRFNEVLSLICTEDDDRNADFACEAVSDFAMQYGNDYKVETAMLAAHSVARFGHSSSKLVRMAPIYTIMSSHLGVLPFPELGKIVDGHHVDFVSFVYDIAVWCLLRKEYHRALEILDELKIAVGRGHKKVENLHLYIMETLVIAMQTASTSPPFTNPPRAHRDSVQSIENMPSLRRSPRFPKGPLADQSSNSVSSLKRDRISGEQAKATTPKRARTTTTKTRGTVKKGGSKKGAKSGRPSTSTAASRKKDKKKKDTKKKGGKKTGVQKKNRSTKKQNVNKKAIKKTRTG